MDRAGIQEGPAWAALTEHYEQVRSLEMRELFAEDPFDRFSLRLNDILFDFSKNRITDETLRLLIDLAQACDVPGWRERMFAGEAINHTEHRAVLHTALRNQSGRPMPVGGVDVMPEVQSELERVKVAGRGDTQPARGAARPISRSPMSSVSASADRTWVR
jgi:glucose-6-phosphate isomerase